MRDRCARGFTLIELLLALSIAVAVLVIAFGGLRVGFAAWSKGEERTAKLDHARGLVLLLERALTGASPYRMALQDDQEARILFEGRPDRLTFVTLSAPFPAGAPIAFTAVSLSAHGPGLALHQQVLPNRIALDRLAAILVDPRTIALRFRYLAAEAGAWRGEWDIAREERLPRAVEITLLTGAGAGSVAQTLTVPIRATSP